MTASTTVSAVDGDDAEPHVCPVPPVSDVSEAARPVSPLLAELAPVAMDVATPASSPSGQQARSGLTVTLHPAQPGHPSGVEWDHAPSPPSSSPELPFLRPMPPHADGCSAAPVADAAKRASDSVPSLPVSPISSLAALLESVEPGPGSRSSLLGLSSFNETPADAGSSFDANLGHLLTAQQHSFSSISTETAAALIQSQAEGLLLAHVMAMNAADHNQLEDPEAAEQAEAGIVADDNDVDGVASDAGYESGDASNASTSLASSVLDFPFENGRRYHRFREGQYAFPNDDIEQEREDMKHAMVKMLCQQLHYAPIGNSPQQILDIGTGTGIWAIEMGDQFPSASVLGIDLSPIQPEWVPPNVRFMVDDAESQWLHPRNYFDLIHSRHTVMAIKDWPKLLRQAYDHLRPGGWLELHEIFHFPISANNSMPPTHPVAQYWARIHEGLSALGVEMGSVRDLARMVRDAGFTELTERVLQIPLGTWPKNKSLKTVGLYWRTILLDGIQAIALGPLTRGCGWSPEQVELFLVQVRKAYFDNSSLMYMPLHIIYAQKPVN